MKKGEKKKDASSSSTPTKVKESVAEVLARKEALRSDADMKLHTDSGQAFLLKYAILGMIFLLAFLIRLFSVVRYESIIHEFDPWFNFRTTQHIVSEGFMDFLNWFDERSWYPMGRHIGATIYPGLMATAGFVHYVMNALNITIDIRNVCVLIGPFFSANTAIVAYLMSKDIHDEGTGLFAAAFTAIVPGFISRSVAGSYDNEAVAIFALLITFYFWVKAVKTGSMLWAAATAIGYFYMVAAWGGYIYITNLLPLYTLVMVLFGRFSHRLYIAYSVVYVLGTLLSMQVFIVEFKPVRSAEHMPALGVFCLLQVYGFLEFVQGKLSSADYKTFKKLALLVLIALGIVFTVASAYYFEWTGRLHSLLNLTHAKKFIPIISSVAEHQPALWDSLFFDTHMLIFLVPCGLYWCFKNASDGAIFLILYALSSLYFACAMVRLVLVVAPIVCLLGGVAVSFTLRRYMSMAKQSGPDNYSDISVVMTAVITLLLFCYASHCTYVASEAYSSPSIVLQARGHDGSRIIFDDFREAYRWLSQNTGDDEIIMSWWDYGYQISGMGNRTVLVDGNTRNNTHIARVGRMFAASEERAYQLARELDVDYALVIFGGMVGYQSDDINKFLWMVRISGGLFPEIREQDYLTPEGHYRIDSAASKTMLNSLMYKLCYYRFGDVGAEYGRPGGFDRVRNAEIGNKKVELKYFEEAYTTQHWLVRVYRVKKPSNLS